VPFLNASPQVGVAQTVVSGRQKALVQSPPTRQLWPFVQSGHVPPPQSTSVSTLFLTESVHVGAQEPPTQLAPMQSAALPQAFPGPHLAQLPPQSTSVSLPFLNVSLQLGAAQSDVSGWQKVLVQSPPTRQPWPFAQSAHVPPPQSTSVSALFCSKSVQVGAQKPPKQLPPMQSAALPHAWSGPHLGHTSPPQSASVSLPLATPSVQVAAVHVPEPQRKLTQSASATHSMPSRHFPQDPPQSTSVSLPFLTRSAQLAVRHVLLWQTSLGQSVPALHSTHVPTLLHITPPF
jgi:hypothetical protein